MSFKREGDNEELLNNLKHQRVRGLLSSHIPEDEVKLLSNGRLTCLICQHRPIFDNVTVLSVHRRGKRHLYELSRYIKCKQEYDLKQIKAKQLKELQQSAEKESQQSLDTGQESGDCRPLLSRKMFVQSISLGSGGKKCQTLKQSGHKGSRKTFLEVPSIEKHRTVLKSSNNTQQSASSAVRHYLKSLPRKRPIEKVIENCRDNYGGTPNKQCELREEVTSSPQSHPVLPETNSADALTTPKPEEKSVEYEIQLRMSGWIKDAYGNWIKDPEVEFDSDEDAVPPP